MAEREREKEKEREKGNKINGGSNDGACFIVNVCMHSLDNGSILVKAFISPFAD
jgi:hypothetical protein